MLFGFVLSGIAGPVASATEPLPAPATTEASPSPEAGPEPVDDPVLVAEQQAADKAAATGADVVVDALTTPTELVTASPDGKFTKTLTVEPTRMLHDGGWAAISTDLIEAGGVLRPKMAPAALSLGKGGSAHISTVGHDGD
ncbi:hypothetical protein [Pseudarthrobacter sp. J75]|uniref:hypothetical protein n=1 Tax=Pseudarthrobacter sp. J75 TaxID=3116486 RepID=UPI002E80D769|nr:hypothetical protein [Pseudarthrobacter sp. J75]